MATTPNPTNLGVWTTIKYRSQPGTDTTCGEVSRDYGALDTDPRQVFVRNLRGSEHRYNLHHHGFQFITHSTSCHAFDDPMTVKNYYYSEVEALVKRVLETNNVHAYQHVMRCSDANARHTSDSTKTPVSRPHIDQTAASLRENLQSLFSSTVAGKALNSKCVHLSVWRPLQTVQRDPIGLIDASTCPDGDLVHFKREPLAGAMSSKNIWSYHVKAGHGHAWNFLEGQTKDEVLIIKLSDERDGEKSTGTPHASFETDDTQSLPGRESVEVRCVAMF